MIKVGIIGGSGYTGGELIRLLLAHPAVEINFVYSRTKAGDKVSSVHPDLLGTTELTFSGEINLQVPLVFLCLGHGHSKEFLSQHIFDKETKIIDLSTDFRHAATSKFLNKNFVYGLPEKNKTAIENAQYIANPGCFATALQLALLPLASCQKLTKAVHINGTTGSTGAGYLPTDTTHYSWRDNNLSWYKAFDHQHLVEVREQLTQASLVNNLDFSDENRKTKLTSAGSLVKETGSLGPFYFIPQRGNFTRGIFATLYTSYEGSLEQALESYENYYARAPFTHISRVPISLKQVVNTNQCHIHLHKHQDQLLLTVALDNLLKGASGQAIQNMNLIFGWEEHLGLQLKGTAF